MRLQNDMRRRLELGVSRVAVAAVSKGAEGILGSANQTVPIDTGRLEQSGGTSAEATRGGGASASVHYGSDPARDVVAVVQHEDMTFRHSPGRRAKWLEMTCNEQAGRVGTIVADEMRKAFR